MNNCLAKFTRKLVIPLLGVLFASQTFAADDKVDQLLTLTLEELLDIKISVATNTSQDITTAPLIVSRYNQADLARMGINSLEEMLNFVPGVLTQRTQSGNSAIVSRGVVEGFNQKVLFLLDGIPYWAPSHSSVPLHGIPFDSIDHIEVVRGPAAVFYGTNASAAVINVVTTTNGKNISIQAGEDSNRLSASMNLRDDTGYFSLSAEKNNNDGREANIQDISPALGLATSGKFLHSIESESLMVKASVDNFNLNAHLFDTTYNGRNAPVDFILTKGLNYQGQLYHLDYKIDFANHSMKLFTDYNQFEIRFPISNILVAVGGQGDGGFQFEDGDDNIRWRTGISLDSKFSKQLSFVYGFESERRQISEYQIFNAATGASIAPIMASGKSREQAFYIQSDYNHKNWRFIVGARYVDNEDSGSHTSPQLSAIYKIDSQQSIKLLMSEGFNSPNFVQKGINLGPGLQGNPNLKAEIIETTDLAYSYSVNNHLFVLNLFRTEAKNLIQRDVSTGIIKFDNTGEILRSGLELDYQTINKEWTFFSNLSYVHQGDKNKQDASAFVIPRYLASVGTSYKLSENHGLGGSLNLVSDRANSKGFSDLSLKYSYNKNNWQFSARLSNALSDDITSADVQNFSESMRINFTDGVNFSIGLSYSFK